MLSRSEIRYACFRVKNNAAEEKHQKIVQEVVFPAMKEPRRIDDFAVKWDIVLTKDGSVQIVDTEQDEAFIKDTCLEASLLVKLGKDLSDLDVRKQNVITVVESEMLSGITTWENYNKTWVVVYDPSLKRVKIKLLNVKPSQLEVTDEMIENSKKSDGAAFTEQPPQEITLKAKRVSKKEVEKLLKLHNKE